MTAKQMFDRVLGRLHRFAEAVAAALLAVIFAAFIVQIVLRYLLNWPVGWTTELSLACWLWLVLWGAAFVLKDDEEIRIDLLVDRAGPIGRRVIAALAAVSVIVLFGLSLKPSYEYVAFMKVEKSSYLGVRMDVTYSIYIVFVVAVVLRALRTLVRAVRGTLPAPRAPGATSSAL
ncbi:MAG TPA: TRAP transporter small permease subunit [Ramlibacter sp.]|nr:TRAP transporter small permease subunit [Ramlibacter sp.]